MSELLNTFRRRYDRRGTVENCLRDTAGQSMIELALVLPPFFMLMFGFINFCLVMFGLCNISYACRQASRYACVHSQTSLAPAAQTNVDAIVAPFIFKYPSNTYTDTLSYGSGGNILGGTATVQVTITYNIVLPFARIPAFTLTTTASSAIVQ